MCTTDVRPGRYAIVETMSSGLREVRCLRITPEEFHWLKTDGTKQSKRVQWNVRAAQEQVQAEPARCAVRFMRRTGRCFRCARALTAQVSLDRACGPRCWRRIQREWEEGSLDELVSLYATWTEDDLSTQEAA